MKPRPKHIPYNKMAKTTITSLAKNVVKRVNASIFCVRKKILNPFFES